jgi:hypothetical protein
LFTNNLLSIKALWVTGLNNKQEDQMFPPKYFYTEKFVFWIGQNTYVLAHIMSYLFYGSIWWFFITNLVNFSPPSLQTLSILSLPSRYTLFNRIHHFVNKKPGPQDICKQMS